MHEASDQAKPEHIYRNNNMSRVERTKEIKISRVERIDDEPETKTKVIINAARTPRTAGGGGAPPERAAAAGRNIDKASQAYIDRLKQKWAAEEAADHSS
ncbi:Os05g0142600 [Oryza sativa Japonica Group]|uniref:Os05g0142600 protein n=6 Tax=Oryza TaxID=4527 RepID=Q0DKU8_ORYSJ|nr:Os05g0142600 [Oryza sativa Japonica Group]|eukprot:NP_001054611.2 Os05g0142600 [Oryza sativa Japonica Group]